MTALQWIVKEAKAIKNKYPKRFSKWTEYVAQASAIYASKHKGKSPVGKKKPSIIKKAASKVKKLVKKAKDAYYEGYNEAAKKSNPLMVKKRKVGAAPKKKAVPKKVAKKVVKKSAPKKSVSLHKDTKSHNVNIKVMSGIHKTKRSQNQEMIKKYNDTKNEILKQEQYLINWKFALKSNKGFPANIQIIKTRISEIKKLIAELKTHARQLKKHI